MSRSDQIIQAATELFALNGYSGTPLQAVADRVQITKQSLLYYFSSKELLRQAVVKSIVDHWQKSLPKALLSTRSGEKMLDRTLDVLIEFFTQDGHRANFILREALDRPGELGTTLREHLWPLLSFVTDYVEAGKKKGEVRRDLDAEAFVVRTASAAINIVAMAPVFRVVIGGKEEAKNFFDRQIEEFSMATKAALFNRQATPSSNP